MVEYWNQIGPEAQEWLVAAGVFGTFLLLALLVRLAWNTTLTRLVRRTRSQLDDVLLTPVRRLVVWALVLAGLYSGLQSVTSVRESPVLKPILEKGFAIAWVILVIATSLKIFGLVLALRAPSPTEENFEAETRMAFVRKLVAAVVWIFGGLYILRALGVDTSPLLAGGAVGGLVLGLALQDTLSNIFAGFFLNIDRPVRIGNLVKLESGEEGFVEDIGWRYTKIRLWSNVLVVVPNNKISQSLLTNYNLPTNTTSIYTHCGVAYDSDLEHVERVALEVAKGIVESDDAADKSYDPILRYQEFGDSSINFMVIFRASDPTAQFRLKSEYIKRLHRRFNEEGIEIPFPIRTLVFKNDLNLNETASETKS
jgi:small-conductance mechanosensitive channel